MDVGVTENVGLRGKGLQMESKARDSLEFFTKRNPEINEAGHIWTSKGPYLHPL